MTSRLISSLIFTLALPLMAAEPKAAATAWRDTVRDVYIDDAIDRPAQVFINNDTAQFVVVSEKLNDALIFDTKRGVAWRTPKSSLVIAKDRLTAAADITPPRRSRRITSTSEGVHSTLYGRRVVVVAPHQSKAGAMSQSELASGFPAWRGSSEAYAPKAESLAKLAGATKPLTVKIAFATWCGDSKKYVPQALAAIAKANNPNIRVELTAIGPDFHSPLDYVQQERIINIPTIIVEQDGVELGRIVETPALPTIEEDLAAILSGTLPRHEGRWQREARIASGTYLLESQGVPAGSEEWSLYSTPTGGRLLHSVIVSGESEREVWQTFDAAGRTTFVEITERSGTAARRTRYRRGTNSFTAHSRGNESGIIDQVVAVPETCGFDSASVAAAAWECQGGDATDLVTYRVAECDVTGRLERVTVRRGSQSTALVAGQKVEVRQFEKRASSRTSTIDVAETLNIPVALSTSEGKTAELVALEIFSR